MFGIFRKKAAASNVGVKPNGSVLVPRIKHRDFLVALSQMNVPADEMPYTEPLVADLLVTYAFDLPDFFKMASARSLRELSLTPADARELALRNLSREIPQIGLEEMELGDGHKLYSVATGKNCEACSLLVASFWDGVSREVAEIVAIVPSRDVVLFCNAKSTEGLIEMKELAEIAYAEGGHHALSRCMLTWREGRWTEYGASS